MAKSFWFPFYYMDYVRDTVLLTPEQHGLYLLLMLAYYQLGEPLPDDDRKLAMLLKIQVSEFKKHRKELSKYFHVGGGKWSHGRIDKEIAAIESRKKSGKNAAKYRWPNCRGDADRIAE